ncbi:hypothetical protein I4200191B4_31390 [Pseudoflavonifractor gallinarum]
MRTSSAVFAAQRAAVWCKAESGTAGRSPRSGPLKDSKRGRPAAVIRPPMGVLRPWDRGAALRGKKSGTAEVQNAFVS